jgi:hypothetical protein
MGIYKQGLDRKQQLLFPPSLDELVDENNIARAICKCGFSTVMEQLKEH